MKLLDKPEATSTEQKLDNYHYYEFGCVKISQANQTCVKTFPLPRKSTICSQFFLILLQNKQTVHIN